MRILFLFALGVAASCAGRILLALPVQIMWIFAAFAVLSGILSLFLRKKWTLSALILFLGLSVGMAYCGYYESTVVQSNIVPEGTCQITCRDYSWETAYGSACEGEMELEGKTAYVRVYLRDTVSLGPGDRIEGSFRFSASYPAQKAKGIFLTATQNGDVEILKAERVPLKYYGAELRHRCEEILRSVIPEDAQPFAFGLLLGDTYELDHATDLSLRIAGVRHMVAVSGMHISILFLLISLVTGRNRLLLVLVGVPVTVLFSWMIGLTPSVLRASIVQIVFLLAMLWSRRFDALTALGLAALFMLLENPYRIASIGFQLSFSGALGIALFSPKIREFLKNFLPEKKTKFRKFCQGIILAVSLTLGAGVLTTPLAAYYFGCISLVGVFSNLILTPPMTVIFYGLLFSCLAGVIWFPAGKALGAVTGLGIRIFLWVVDLLSKIPLAAVYTASIYITLWLVITYLLGAFLLWKKKYVTAAISVVLLLFLSLGASWLEPRMGECRVSVLDVGQGQCILLQSKGHTVMVDCGGSSDASSADLAAETLLSQGIHKLDALIVSHIDRDHSGGVQYLLERISTEKIILPEYGEAQNFLETVDAIESAHWILLSEDWTETGEEFQISVFANKNAKTSNESSLCVLFQTQNCDILITGDQPKGGERKLMERVELPELELLVAGHHGAQSSTSSELLAATSPEIAVISVGENTYGHPNDETLARLLSSGCVIYRTDEMGTIIFRR